MCEWYEYQCGGSEIDKPLLGVLFSYFGAVRRMTHREALPNQNRETLRKHDALQEQKCGQHDRRLN